MSNIPAEEGTRISDGAEGLQVAPAMAEGAVDGQTVVVAAASSSDRSQYELRRGKEDGKELFVRGYDAVGSNEVVATEIGLNLAVDFNGRVCRVVAQDGEPGPATVNNRFAQKMSPDKVKVGGEAYNDRSKEVKEILRGELVKVFYSSFVSKYLSGDADVNKEVISKMMIEGNGFEVDLGKLGIGGRSKKGISVMPHQQDALTARETFLDTLCEHAIRIANECLDRSGLRDVPYPTKGVVPNAKSPSNANFDAVIVGRTIKIFLVFPQTPEKPSVVASATPTPGV